MDSVYDQTDFLFDSRRENTEYVWTLTSELMYQRIYFGPEGRTRNNYKKN